MKYIYSRTNERAKQTIKKPIRFQITSSDEAPRKRSKKLTTDKRSIDDDISELRTIVNDENDSLENNSIDEESDSEGSIHNTQKSLEHASELNIPKKLELPKSGISNNVACTSNNIIPPSQIPYYQPDTLHFTPTNSYPMPQNIQHNSQTTSCTQMPYRREDIPNNHSAPIPGTQMSYRQNIPNNPSSTISVQMPYTHQNVPNNIQPYSENVSWLQSHATNAPNFVNNQMNEARPALQSIHYFNRYE